MAIAHAKPVPTVLNADIATAAAAAAFAPNQKPQLQPLLAQLKQPPQKLVFTLGSVKRLPKKERGVKEVVVAMVIAGSIENNIRDYGKP
ncbi:MAG: hypothetical protein EOP00_09720 [Pedobacter sp.]|nr:MAG: hypothetical protein EOP00_09720 [Pedobacter sp.]